MYKCLYLYFNSQKGETNEFDIDCFSLVIGYHCLFSYAFAVTPDFKDKIERQPYVCPGRQITHIVTKQGRYQKLFFITYR
jgi:hypothetical protein